MLANLTPYAAIDIGSNAVRLLICHVYQDINGKPVFKKYALIRVPVRLGDEVFSTGWISEGKLEKLMHAMSAFYHLMKVHEVVQWRACATSAMREAKNGIEVVRLLKEKTGIAIEVIHGSEEADLIFNSYLEDMPASAQAFLYIDVGGGSTELTLFSAGKKVFSESFPIGTVRTLQGSVAPDTLLRMQETCKRLALAFPNMSAIGSGGNIIKLFKMAEIKEGKPLKRSKLRGMYKNLVALSYEERVQQLGLNPDRADVIIPAAEIFLHVCKHANIKDIFVPKVGLSDGIVRQLHAKHGLTPP
jgi:exopolyphosphatase / guanosine-5'-triphosphate,3'-diphosphate pyrophosphatase